MVQSFINIDGNPNILRIETTGDQEEIKIPPFVQVLKEVTHDRNYETNQMAYINYKMPEQDKQAIQKKLGKWSGKKMEMEK